MIEVAEGDMRKSLNILRSCHSAFGAVNEQNVYLTSGLPLPADVDEILKRLKKCCPCKQNDKAQLAFGSNENSIETWGVHYLRLVCAHNDSSKGKLPHPK